MAFNTKIELYDGKVYQGDGHTLTLSGDTIIASSGDLRYQTHPTFTVGTQIVDKCYVDTSTGALGANNGLTRRGNNITLGGALTGATTITAGAGTSLMFTDSRTPSIGIQYGGDYSAGYTQRSLVDAAYVTGKTSQAILTATNGLTKTGTSVKLGGTLTGTTTITAGANAFNVVNTNGNNLCVTNDYLRLGTACQYINQSPTQTTIYQQAGGYCNCIAVTNNNICFTTDSNLGHRTLNWSENYIAVKNSDVDFINFTELRTTPTEVTVLGEPSTFGGVKYGENYSGLFTARSIPDVAYVTGRTSQAILTACNGLTKSGTNVKLGGALIETTNILGANKILSLGTNASALNCLHVDAQRICFSNSGNTFCQVLSCTGFDSCYGNGASAFAQLYYNHSPNSFMFDSASAVNCRATFSINTTSNCLESRSGTSCYYKYMNMGGGFGETICSSSSNLSTFADFINKDFSYTINSGIILSICSGGTARYGSLPTITNVCDLVHMGYVTGVTTTSGVQTANNGITKTGTNIKLGGALTEQTTINGAQTLRFNVCAVNITGTTGFALSTGNGVITDTGNKGGLQYAANYGGFVVARSIPDAQWVTGKTNTVATDLANNYYNRTCINSYTGKTNTRLNTIEADYVTGSTNGISSADVHRLKLGGAITEDTSITGAFLFAANMNRVNITGATGGVNLGGSVSLKNQPTSALGDILTINPTTGLIGKTVLSSLGGLTGATNGIGTTGQKVCLGGALVAATTFTGAYAMNFCNTGGMLMRGTTDTVIDGQSNAGIILKSQSGTVATSTDFTNAIGINIDFNGAGGFNIIDNRAGAAATGIVYNADYSTNYTARSLVDKNYVDTIATGLQVHTAAKVATTGPITLANTQTIDGVVVSNPDRVLVKNQADATTNGLYTVVNAGAWTRTADFDGTPANEISNGDLIPVTSGLTQNNSIWVLTSKNPIIVGTTNLVFTQFSTVIDIQAGSGIAITQVGGQHSACVLLGGGIASSASCGLAVSTNGLCVSSTIAGCGLTYNAGVLCVNATTGGATAAIPVKFNASCGLVINCADINTALNAITGATNGLTKAGQCVKLGGAISEVTTVTLNAGTTGLNITDSRVGSTAVGIQYSGNYGANFTARSIPDAAWVTGKTSTAGVQTANNGLTKQGTNVRLGGTLTGATTIDTNANNFNILGGNCNNICVNSTHVRIGTTTSYITQAHNSTLISHTLTTNCNCLTMASDSTCFYGDSTNKMCCLSWNSSGLVIRNTCKTNGDATEITVRPNEITIAGEDFTFGGVKYVSDYSTLFTANSLVNAAWVTGLTNSIRTTYVCSATNGLTKTTTNVKLGGTLCEATTINGGTFALNLGATGSLLGAVTICSASFTNSPTGNIVMNAGGTVGICPTGQLTLCSGGLISINKIATYSGDFASSVTARTIPDAAWVTGRTSTSGVQTANNGLTKQGTNVRLGGTLTGNTCIGLATKCFVITGGSVNFNVKPTFISIGDSDTSLSYICKDATSTEIRQQNAGNCLSDFIVQQNGIFATSCVNATSKSCLSVLNSGNISQIVCSNASNYVNLQLGIGTMTITGAEASGFRGVQYGADYSTNYVARSIPDAAWVTGKTSTSGVQTANNGLTKQGTNVRLGGTLTGNTTITGAFTLNICSGAKLNTACGYQISGSTMFRTSPASLSNIFIGLNSGGGATGGACNIGIGMYTLSGNTTGNYNVAVGSCSLRRNTSGEYNNALGYSLVANTTGSWNNAFGTNALQANTSGCQNNGFGAAAMSLNTTGCGNNAFGSNALQSNTSGHYNVSLGDSTLYDNTTGSRNTAVGTNALTYNTTGKCNTSVGGNSMWCNCTGSGNTTIGTSGLYRNKIGCNNVAIGYQAGYTATGSSKLYIANNSGSTLIYGDFATSEVTLPLLKLSTTPASGTIADSVLVWNSSDKAVKTVNGAALGDKNNIYATTAVTSTVTLHSGSSFVVLVNNAVPVTITLPTTPKNGQVFKIKNVSGSSLTNPITIAGNGRNIDGSPNALVNTDYGALELVYNTTLNAWYSLAFIN